MNIILDKFSALKTDKQERILNAAISEFASKGYANASTNEIVKEAGISKGLLFHYFNNKKDLFLFLYDYSLRIFIDEFMGKMDLTERDILIRMRQKAILKSQVIKKHPDIFDFIVAANSEESPEIRDELKCRNKQAYTSHYTKIFEDIDTAKFKKGIDIARAINIISWTMEGLRTQEQEKLKQLHSSNQAGYEKISAETSVEMDVYTELLKECFYKE